MTSYTKKGLHREELHGEGTTQRGAYTKKGISRKGTIKRGFYGKKTIWKGDYIERGLHEKGRKDYRKKGLQGERTI